MESKRVSIKIKVVLAISLFSSVVGCYWAVSSFVKTVNTMRVSNVHELFKIESYLIPTEDMELPIEEGAKPVSEVVNEFEPFNIPLSKELQKYTYELSVEYDIPITLVLAVMSVESNFQEDVISSTRDYGIMQINSINHDWLAKEHDLTDMLNVEQNIKAGVIMLTDLYHKYGNIHKVLMAYNKGPTGARRLWEQGIYQSRYSQLVVNEMEQFERR